MTVSGKARECAKSILSLVQARSYNWRYQASYFGKAMRGHLEAIKRDEVKMRPETAALVSRADEALRTHCDGQDCSFQSVPMN